MADIDKLCQLAQAAVGKAPYPTSGSGTLSYAAIMNGSPVDCSGFTYALLKQIGIKSFHGSNTLWREYMTDKGSVSDHKSSNGYPKNVNPLKSSDLKKGMFVYKWDSATPSKFKDNLGDYKHVGIVTSVKPLHIVHSTSVNYAGVVRDTSIGKWCAWGVHKGLDIDNNQNIEQIDIGGDTVQYNAVVKTSGGKLNVRESAGGSVIGKFSNGAKVNAGQQSGDWIYCSDGKTSGWCSKSYIKITSESASKPQVDDTPANDGQVTIADLQKQIQLLKARVSVLQSANNG